MWNIFLLIYQSLLDRKDQKRNKKRVNSFVQLRKKTLKINLYIVKLTRNTIVYLPAWLFFNKNPVNEGNPKWRM